MQFTDHPIHEAPTLLGRDPAGNVLARFKDGTRRLTPQQLADLWRIREEQIANEKEDPLRYEWEPEAWRQADAILDEHRELLILGGNRSGKSSYAAKRIMRAMLDTPDGRFWCFQETSGNSIEMQQPLLWKYMPPELRNTRKTKVTNISYGQKTGFAENSFVLPNGAQCFFRNYSQDVSTIEGGEVDAIWFDELVPLNFLETARFRLITRKGWLLLTFTPIEGYSSVVKDYLSGATTLEDREAELLPIYGRTAKAETGDLKPESDQGARTPPSASPSSTPSHSGLRSQASSLSDKIITGYERLPILQLPSRRKGRVTYFWTQDNPFSGYPELRTELLKAKKDEILVRAYGVPTKSIGNQFPRFNDKVHVLPDARIPRTGTHYHVVDPCSGRNWFMIWARFDDIGRCFIIEEWPNQDRYIPGWGFPGAWAEPDGKRHDGRPGDAQKSCGFGLQEYKAEIDAVELELAKLTARPGEPIPVFERLMDSRYGNAATVAREGATTLIDECAELGLNFLAAPGDAIHEGVSLINDWLSYDPAKPITALNQPRLYVSERCKNTIYALQEWTGRDAKTGACKDPVDVLRYLVLSGATHHHDTDLSFEPRGSY
jgi:phage terminase large subunit-like protein